MEHFKITQFSFCLLQWYYLVSSIPGFEISYFLSSKDQLITAWLIQCRNKQNWSLSTFWYSISVFEAEFGNPCFETPENRMFSIYAFLSNLWLCTSPSCGTWTFFSVIVFLCSATNEGFQTLLFKKRALHCRFLMLGITQKILTEILHSSFEIKMMVKIYVTEIIFRSHEPFQSYQLSGLTGWIG